MKISVYGIGNFGYAFLRHLDLNNGGRFDLFAYDYKPERVDYLTAHRRHPVLHQQTWLSGRITFSHQPAEVIADAQLILLAVPSPATTQVLQQINQQATGPIIIVNTAKSLDIATGQRLSEVVAQSLKEVEHTYALLAGGTIVSDLFAQQPLGVSLACPDQSARQVIKEVFSSPNFYLYPTSDLAGVEYAAASKNIISILAGMVNGLGFSYGAETHLISRLAEQVAQVCISHLDAQPATFSMGSQCWGNDLWMSCTGPTRNRQFGQLVGAGQSPTAALKQMADQHKLVEGVNTLAALSQIEQLRKIPLIEILCQIVIDQTATVEDLQKYIEGSGLKGL